MGAVQRADRRRFRRAMAIVAALLMMGGATPASAAFCAAHPIHPLCCPSPCPVADAVKLDNYLDQAEQAWQEVGQYAAIAKGYSELWNGFGPGGPLSNELRRLPGTLSTDLSSMQTMLPVALKPADLVNPRAVSEILKGALFEPGSLDAVSPDERVGRAQQRADVATDENLDALASALHTYARLPGIAVDGGQQIALASRVTNARGDIAANSATKQALFDSIGGLQQIMASWAAAEATAAALHATATLGRLPVPPASPGTSISAVSLASKAGLLDHLRQARATVGDMDVTVAALVNLHNERHAAAVMLAQYAGLANTIDSDRLADLFRQNDADAARQILGQIFTDGSAAFHAVQGQLLAIDRTGWKDYAAKLQAAASAAQSVVTALEANSAAFGTVANQAWYLDAQGNYDASVPNALQDSFAAWLEDDKLVRFWHPLRQAAEQAKDSLDQRLAQVSQRRGFDIAGPAAQAAEANFLDQFSGQQRQLAALDAAGFNAAQQAALAGTVTTLRQGVADVQADPGALRFVSVGWPQ